MNEKELRKFQEKNIYKCFCSDRIIKSIKSSDFAFSIQDMITIIYNCDFSLSEKVKMLEELKSLDIEDIYKEKIEKLLAICEEFSSFIFKNDITFEIVDSIKFKDRKEFLKYVETHKMKKQVIVYSSKKKYYIHFNDEKLITSFDSDDKEEQNYVYNNAYTYVDIPNNYKKGEIVRIKGDKKDWVIIQTSELTEKQKKMSDYIDSCVTIVPFKVFVKNDKKEIERYHEHCHLTFIK